MITLIYSVDKTEDDDVMEITAVVEDTRLAYSGSRFDPPEYGPGVCKATVYLDEGEKLPTDEDELISYLEKMDLDWELCSEDDF